jgi:uroporphyrinogen-III synthase
MRRLLVLRPEPGASATVKRARERGLDARSVPLFTIEAVPWEAPDPVDFDGLLITSANSIRAAGEGLGRLRGLPVYAVGEASAEAAREAGLGIAATGESGVDRLLGSIYPGLRLLNLCGVDRREPLEAPQQISPLAVYRARPTDAPDLGAARGAVALIHSPRAGRRFAELMNERGATAVVAISQAAAEAIGSAWEQVELAERPDEDALLALAARLCNKPPL